MEEPLSPQGAGSTPERRIALRISLVTAVVGAAIGAFLFRYNLAGRAIWSTGPDRPSASWEEYLVVNTCALFFVPWLTLALQRLELVDFGARRPEGGAGRIAAGLFLLMLPVLVAASTRADFQNYYPLVSQAAYDWRWLLYHEASYGFYLFCWEWFFRGYLTFGLERRFGAAAAVCLQAAGFGLLHIGKPLPEVAGSFVAGLALGWLALKGRSFAPCFWLHWAVSATFDLLVIWQRPGGLF